VNTHKLYT